MSTSSLPDMKQKQKLLYADDISAEILIKHGMAFYEQGWFSDALDFFSKAEHTEGLEMLKEAVVQQGDAFLFNRCLVALGIDDAGSQWCEVADRALTLGKLQFAREGYRRCGDRKSMEKVDRMILPDQESESTEEELGDEPQ